MRTKSNTVRTCIACSACSARASRRQTWLWWRLRRPCSRIGTLNLLPPATCRLGCEGRNPYAITPLHSAARGLARVFPSVSKLRLPTACTWLRSPESAAGLPQACALVSKASGRRPRALRAVSRIRPHRIIPAYPMCFGALDPPQISPARLRVDQSIDQSDHSSCPPDKEYRPKGGAAGACGEFADRNSCVLCVSRLWIPGRHRQWIEAKFRSSPQPTPLLRTPAPDRDWGESNGTD
jgi:hypothetical protein